MTVGSTLTSEVTIKGTVSHSTVRFLSLSTLLSLMKYVLRVPTAHTKTQEHQTTFLGQEWQALYSNADFLPCLALLLKMQVPEEGLGSPSSRRR